MSKKMMNRIVSGAMVLLLLPIVLTDCIETEDPVKFPIGAFPDSVINLADLNSAYDDYNSTINQLTGSAQVVFSSNRKSSGRQFDLEQGMVSFYFDQTDGSFGIGSSMTDDSFLERLLSKANTPGNDFGPYRFFNSVDGYEYTLLSSFNGTQNLDFYYLRNRPPNSNIPDIEGPLPVRLLNTSSDDAYISLDANQDSAYFGSNREGNFDIYIQKRPANTDMSSWFNLGFANSVRADSINSPSDDKCPLVFSRIMVFASNRPGGYGGFDLYYSLFRNGKWSAPVNMGEKINGPADEYRPILGYHQDFSNYFLMFSSNRSGGKGGFDLYFSGYEFPK